MVSDPPRGRCPTEILAFAGILGLAVLFRMYGLRSLDMWQDDVWTVYLADHLVSFARHGAFCVDMPLFPATIKVWMWMGGREMSYLRMVSVLLGTGAVAVVYFLGRRYLDKAGGVRAGLLFACSPFTVYYSREIRSYALTLLLSALVLRSFMKMNEGRSMIPFIGFASLLVHTHYMNFLMLPSLAIYLLRDHRERPGRLRGFFKAVLVVIGASLPWLISNTLPEVIAMSRSEGWWVPQPSPLDLLFMLKAWLVGFGASDTLGIGLAVLVAGCISVAFVIRRGAGLPEIVRVGAIICILPPVGVLLVSRITSESAFVSRYFMFCLPGFWLIVAWLLGTIASARGRRLGLAVLLVMFLFAHKAQYGNRLQVGRSNPGVHPRHDYAGAAAFIRAGWRPGDCIGHTCTAAFVVFRYYHLADLGQSCLSAGEIPLDMFFRTYPIPSLPSLVPEQMRRLPEDAASGCGRFWLVLSCFLEPGRNRDNAESVQAWFDAHCVMRSEWRGTGVGVRCYELTE
ncbi:glycosyltransferase family 39 protein [bacterium]|nr:glycosyltransferase family 39 protein [candidate division CSSED10-310 bacterium]